MPFSHKSYARVAMKVAAEKKEHPERFCAIRHCLYRTNDSFCPRHKPVRESGGR